MSLLGRVVRGEAGFDFVGLRRRWLTISGVAIVFSLVSVAVFRLNLSLDFEGGISILVENRSGSSVGDMRQVLGEIGVDGRIEELDDGASLRVRTVELPEDRELEVVRSVAAQAGVAVEETSVDSVGATFGSQITKRAFQALVVFLAVAMLFIAWRFEWKMAVGAIAALFHDLIITVGVYALTRFEVTPATVIAVLTILGYSLYDTVVVYDKVKENVTLTEGKVPYAEVVNRSMNQVLMRSINTSLTSLLPVGSLLLAGTFLLGGSTLTDFALALFVGIAAGTYSSIFVASPLLAAWKESEEEWAVVERRAERHRPPEKPASLEGGVFDSGRPGGSGAQPRPPKKRRRRR